MALYFEAQFREQMFFTTVGVRRINYWYTRHRNCGELRRFKEYGYDFDYCLISSTRLNFYRDLVLNQMFYGIVFSHSKSQQWRVTILEDFLPLEFRAIGLAHEGYHLKQRMAGRSIDNIRDKEEVEALCE